MPYGLKLSLYLFVWIATACFIAFTWLSEANAFVVIAFGLLMSIVMILTGRWLFGRKTLF